MCIYMWVSLYTYIAYLYNFIGFIKKYETFFVENLEIQLLPSQKKVLIN